MPVKAGDAVVTLTVPPKVFPAFQGSRRRAGAAPRQSPLRAGQIHRDVAGRRQGQRVEVRIRRQHKRGAGPAVQGLRPADLGRAQEIHIPRRRQGRIARHGEGLSQGQGNVPAVVVAVRLPPTVEVANVSAPPLVRLTEPSVGAAVVLKLALPATVSAPDWLISPPAVTLSVPLTVEAPRFNALASRNTTLLPLVTATVLKLLPAESSVMLLPARRPRSSCR